MKTNRKCLNRNTIALFVGMICFSSSLRAQGVVGIFLSEEDFHNGKLSFVKAQNPGCKIRVRSASAKRNCKIKCGKVTHYLNKDSIYGYKDKSGAISRFYKRVSYNLINPGEEIQLYQIQISGPTKYEPPFISYYFSRNAEFAIYLLTVNNVLRVFADNKRFTEMVELRYRYDNELMEFDAYHNKYKLNCILELSKK